MLLLRGIKALVLIICLVAFSFQMYVSINQLILPPVVVSVGNLKLNENDPPMITICPVNQFDPERLKSYGYDDRRMMISGFGNNSQFLNLSFWDIVNNTLAYSPDTDVDFRLRNEKTPVYNMSSFKKRFYPLFGYCWEISDYVIQNEILITGKKIFNVFNMTKIFLTDKLLRTVPALDLSSHRGEPILMQNGSDKTYLVDIEKYPFFDPYKPDNCKNYKTDEHEECVDEKLKDYRNELMHCRPPWLAKQNACLDMNWYRTENISSLLQLNAFAKNELLRSTRSIINMENFDAKKECPVPCSMTRSNIRTGTKGNTLAGAEVRLVFEERIIYSENTFGYGPSDFLVDLGSSVGLWFGISVFALPDTCNVLFVYFKTVFGNSKKM